MGKKKLPKKQQDDRSLRRTERRESAASPADPTPLRVLNVSSPPSELLGPSVLIPAFFACVVLGTMLYHVPGLPTLKGNELTWPQPLFTAVNAATLTGFQQARNPNDYTIAGQVLTLFLTVAGMLFSFICCGVAVLRIAGLRFKDRHLIATALVSIPVVAALGGIVMLGNDQTFFQSAFQSISAFGNSGLAVGRLPAAGSGYGLLFLLPLAVLGGLGLPVLMEVFSALRRREPLSPHSRAVLNWSAGVYLGLLFVLLLVHLLVGARDAKSEASSIFASAFQHFLVGARDPKSMYIDAVQQAINTRSAGFAFQFASNLPGATTFVLVLAMIIGASPGGSGGGIKVTTLATLTTGTRDLLAGRAAGRRFGAAVLWLSLYLGMLAASTIALLITDPEIHLDRTLFLSASALGNVGLSHNPIDASTPGIYVLCLTMLLGRIAPAIMLWYLIDTTPDAVIAVG